MILRKSSERIKSEFIIQRQVIRYGGFFEVGIQAVNQVSCTL